MRALVVLWCRIHIAVCAEIIHHLDPDDDEEYGPRIYWGGDAPKGKP